LEKSESRKPVEDHAALGDGSQAEFLGQLLDAIPTPVFYKDAKLVYRGCNTAFERFLGRPRQDIIGRTVFELSPLDLAQRYSDQDQALLDNPPVQVYESEVQSGEGRRVVMFHKATYVDESGENNGIVGMIFDITEQRHAEDALRSALEDLQRADERLKTASTVLGAANEGIVAARNAGNTVVDYEIVDVNDAYCRLTGRSKEETLGGRLGSVLSDEDSPGVGAAVEESLRTSGVWKGEVRLVTAEGTPLLAWLSLSAVRDEVGAGASVVGILTDLTQIKETLGNSDVAGQGAPNA
jgi:PAS domain S-box-containing protein